jgi:hypothetical protein
LIAPASGGEGYRVTFAGELVVAGSHEPSLDLARALVARGYVGAVRILDARTGEHRLTITDLEKAARLTVREDARRGPRFVAWKPFPGKGALSGDGKPPAAGNGKGGGP